MFDVQVSVSPVVDLLRDLRVVLRLSVNRSAKHSKGLSEITCCAMSRQDRQRTRPSLSPICLTTDKSRRWYMWYKRTGQSPRKTGMLKTANGIALAR